MQKLAEICVKRPIFALMLMMTLVVSGSAAYLELGVDRFPKLDLPTIAVVTNYPGATPEEVETEVSRIIEDAVARVSGIDELRSISWDGSSFVLITFNLDVDINVGSQDVRDAVNSVLNRLPPTIDPPIIRKSDTESSPIITLAVSGQRDPQELYVLADRAVKQILESARGVAEARIAGASERAVRVEIEASRLAAHGLSITQVRDAIARQNLELPGGRVETGVKELGLRTLGRLEAAREFDDLVVSSGRGAPVRIRDLGRVIDGTKQVRTLCRLDGVPAVVVEIQRQSGANTMEVIHAVKERLERCRELLPRDVTLNIIQDQSRYIEASLHEVSNHLIIGSIMASLVVLVFMKSWRSTIIAAVAIPTSIIATFAAMKALGFTLNNVTMLALVLMVGVVIDDAIVVLENIFHCIEEKGMDPFTAAIEGTREIGLAVLATTLSLVVVFLPVSFLNSVTGRMMYEFGVTATVAILVSMLVSFSLTPMMCSRMLKPTRQAIAGAPGALEQPHSRRGFYRVIEVGYERCLAWSMRWRGLVLLLCAATLVSILPLYNMVKQDYVPTNVDEGEFEVGFRTPEGISVEAMDKTLTIVENEVRSIPGVVQVLSTVGTRGAGSVNWGNLYVRLEPIEERTFSFKRLLYGLLKGDPGEAFRGNYTQRDVMTAVRERLRQYPDLQASTRNQTSLRQGAPVDLDFNLVGPNIEELIHYSELLKAKAETLPGLVDVSTTLQIEKPELLARIDRERAAALGVEVGEIAETLRIAVGGDERVSRYRDAQLDDVYDVELRLIGIDRASPEAISQLYVRAASPPRLSESEIKGMIPVSNTAATGTFGLGTTMGGPRTTSMESAGLTRLDNLVSFLPHLSATRIDRIDRMRSVGIRANIAPGYALGDQIALINQQVATLDLPPGFATSVRGRGRELEKTFGDLQWTIVLSFLFMYIILAAQFEHLLHPVTILTTLPLAIPFGLISLELGGETLNLYSALGVLVLFGVVKKAAILQVDHTNQLRAKGMERLPAIMKANRDRLRPILMTTVAFVAGMVPLLVGTGPGAEERRSIAVLAFGGQSLSLLLTLVAAPVIYSYLDDLGRLLRPRWVQQVQNETQENGEQPATLPEPIAAVAAVSAAQASSG